MALAPPKAKPKKKYLAKFRSPNKNKKNGKGRGNGILAGPWWFCLNLKQKNFTSRAAPAALRGAFVHFWWSCSRFVYTSLYMFPCLCASTSLTHTHTYFCFGPICFGHLLCVLCDIARKLPSHVRPGLVALGIERGLSLEQQTPPTHTHSKTTTATNKTNNFFFKKTTQEIRT